MTWKVTSAPFVFSGRKAQPVMMWRPLTEMTGTLAP